MRPGGSATCASSSQYSRLEINSRNLEFPFDNQHENVCKQVVEPEGNKEEKMLNYEIGIALGFPIHELDEMMKKDNEVLEFRRNILNVTKAAVEERDKEGKRSQALYAFPPEIETSPLPRSLEDKLDKEDKFIISIWQLSPSCEKQKYTVKLKFTIISIVF